MFYEYCPYFMNIAPFFMLSFVVKVGLVMLVETSILQNFQAFRVKFRQICASEAKNRAYFLQIFDLEWISSSAKQAMTNWVASTCWLMTHGVAWGTHLKMRYGYVPSLRPPFHALMHDRSTRPPISEFFSSSRPIPLPEITNFRKICISEPQNRGKV